MILEQVGGFTHARPRIELQKNVNAMNRVCD